jgi:hypothetical protein
MSSYLDSHQDEESALLDSEQDEEKLQVVILEDIPNTTKLLDTWLPNSLLLRTTIDSQEFDYLRTATIVRCLLCKKEFDPSRNGAVNIFNLVQHVRSKHLERSEKTTDEKTTLRQHHMSSFFHSTAKRQLRLQSQLHPSRSPPFSFKANVTRDLKLTPVSIKRGPLAPTCSSP